MTKPKDNARKYIKHVVVDGHKACAECKQNLPVDRFSQDKRNPSGLHYSCKKCISAYGKQTQWARSIRRKYSLTPEEYKRMFDEQGGVCKICGEEPTEKNSRKAGGLNVDHDHSTGMTRGLLCTPCNLMLGYAQDKVEVMKSAIKYIELYKKPGEF